MFLTLTNATTIIDHRRSQRPAGRGSPQVVIAAIADGFAVVDAYTATPTDWCCSVPTAAPSGLQAVDLLLGMHSTAELVVFGPPGRCRPACHCSEQRLSAASCCGTLTTRVDSTPISCAPPQPDQHPG